MYVAILQYSYSININLLQDCQVGWNYWCLIDETILKQFVDYCVWTLLRMMNFQVLWLFRCLIMINFKLIFLSMCFDGVGNLKINDKRE